MLYLFWWNKLCRFFEVLKVCSVAIEILVGTKTALFLHRSKDGVPLFGLFLSICVQAWRLGSTLNHNSLLMHKVALNLIFFLLRLWLNLRGIGRMLALFVLFYLFFIFNLSFLSLVGLLFFIFLNGLLNLIGLLFSIFWLKLVTREGDLALQLLSLLCGKLSSFFIKVDRSTLHHHWSAKIVTSKLFWTVHRCIARF